jgi:hypothetical protein
MQGAVLLRAAGLNSEPEKGKREYGLKLGVEGKKRVNPGGSARVGLLGLQCSAGALLRDSFELITNRQIELESNPGNIAEGTWRAQ